METQRRLQENQTLQQDIKHVQVANQQLQQQLQEQVRGMGQSKFQQKELMSSLQTHKEDMERRLQALSQENETQKKENTDLHERLRVQEVRNEMLSKESQNKGADFWGENRTLTTLQEEEAWWDGYYEPTDNQMKWLQGEMPSAITDMQEQIEQLHVMLERQIQSQTDPEGQSSQKNDISDKASQAETTTEDAGKQSVHFPGVFGSKNFVAQESKVESSESETQQATKVDSAKMSTGAQSNLLLYVPSRLLPDLVESFSVGNESTKPAKWSHTLLQPCSAHGIMVLSRMCPMLRDGGLPRPSNGSPTQRKQQILISCGMTAHSRA